MRGRVLVTDGEQRSALACVRSLGRAGFHCYVLGPERGNLAGASRFCRGRAVAVDPRVDPQGFLDAVAGQVHRWEIDHLLPMTEKSLRAVLPARNLFSSHVSIPFPSHEVFSRVSDKAQVLEAAEGLDIGVPRQWRWDSQDEADASGIGEEHFPVVIKPTRSVPGLGGPLRQAGVTYAAGPAELRRWFERAGEEAFPVLVQERVEGEGAGVFVLLWDGVLRGVVGHRRIREKPPSGGVSVMRESTVVDPGLLERSLALLKDLGWENGVAMVEYKVEPGSRHPWLMEINGRFWGSLQLAVDAGVDFPSLLLRCAAGEAPEVPVVGRPGVKTRWLMGDLDQLLLRLLKSRSTLNLPPGFPGRGRAILEFLWDFRPGVRLEVLKASDPRPFGAEVAEWFRALRS